MPTPKSITSILSRLKGIFKSKEAEQPDNTQINPKIVDAKSLQVFEQNQESDKKPTFEKKVEKHLLKLINEHRASSHAGIARKSSDLRLNKNLSKFAGKHSKYMAQEKSVSHGKGKNDWNARIQKLDPSKNKYGKMYENVTIAFKDSLGGDELNANNIAKNIFKEWEESTDGHNNIMLDPKSTKIGVALRSGIYEYKGQEHRAYYVTAIFSERSPAKSPNQVSNDRAVNKAGVTINMAGVVR